MDDGETTIAICMEFCEGGSLEDIYKRASKINGVIGETILANIADSVSLIYYTIVIFYARSEANTFLYLLIKGL